MAETSSTTAGAQTLLRGLAVLNAVYNGCHELKSIGEFTGTTRSTTHRLVTVLVEKRYLRHVPTQGYQPVSYTHLDVYKRQVHRPYEWQIRTLQRWYLVAPNQNRRVALPLCDSRD